MKKRLKELMQNQSLCAIYTDDRDLSRFDAGFIAAADGEFFLAESIGPYGDEDGVFACAVEHIVKLEAENAYCKRVKKLFYHKKQSRYEKISCGGDVLEGLLKFALKNKKICTVELCDSCARDIVGYVVEFDEEEDVIKVLALDEDGQDDGTVYADTGDITRVTCDSRDERKLEILKL